MFAAERTAMTAATTARAADASSCAHSGSVSLDAGILASIIILPVRLCHLWTLHVTEQVNTGTR